MFEALASMFQSTAAESCAGSELRKVVTQLLREHHGFRTENLARLGPAEDSRGQRLLEHGLLCCLLKTAQETHNDSELFLELQWIDANAPKIRWFKQDQQKFQKEVTTIVAICSTLKIEQRNHYLQLSTPDYLRTALAIEERAARERIRQWEEDRRKAIFEEDRVASQVLQDLTVVAFASGASAEVPLADFFQTPVNPQALARALVRALRQHQEDMESIRHESDRSKKARWTKDMKRHWEDLLPKCSRSRQIITGMAVQDKSRNLYEEEVAMRWVEGRAKLAPQLAPSINGPELRYVHCLNTLIEVFSRRGEARKSNENENLGIILSREEEIEFWLQAGQAIQCPLTQDFIREPVTCEDGRCYEKSAITEWLRQHSQSPVTRGPLTREGIRGLPQLNEIYQVYLRGCRYLQINPDTPPQAPRKILVRGDIADQVHQILANLSLKAPPPQGELLGQLGTFSSAAEPPRGSQNQLEDEEIQKAPPASRTLSLE